MPFITESPTSSASGAGAASAARMPTSSMGNRTVTTATSPILRTGSLYVRACPTLHPAEGGRDGTTQAGGRRSTRRGGPRYCLRRALRQEPHSRRDPRASAQGRRVVGVRAQPGRQGAQRRQPPRHRHRHHGAAVSHRVRALPHVLGRSRRFGRGDRHRPGVRRHGAPRAHRRVGERPARRRSAGGHRARGRRRHRPGHSAGRARRGRRLRTRPASRCVGRPELPRHGADRDGALPRERAPGARDCCGATTATRSSATSTRRTGAGAASTPSRRCRRAPTQRSNG